MNTNLFSKYITVAVITILLVLLSTWCLRSKEYEAVGFLCVSISILIPVSFILWNVLSNYLNPNADRDKFENRKDFIDLLVKVIGGTTLLITLFTAWKSIKDTQTQLEQNRVQFEQNKISTERQKRDERFFDSIKLLESKDVTVRAGAIFALGQIAQQSSKEAEEIEKKAQESNKQSTETNADAAKQNENIQQINSQYWSVMQIITGAIKDKYPIIKIDQKNNTLPNERDIAPIDLQAAMTVIGYRTYHWNEDSNQEKGSEPYRLNLANIDLRKLLIRVDNKKGANFDGIQFYNSNLEGANFTNASLNSAIFENANLKKAIFYRSSLTNTGFRCADVERADFSKIEVTDIDNFAFNLSFAKNPLNAIIQPDVRKKIQENFGGNQCS